MLSLIHIFNLTEKDGLTVLKTLRKDDKDTKVLILSARCEVADKVNGLDAGANDYLTCLLYTSRCV